METVTQFNTNPRDFRLYLQEELLRRCKSNPSYSMRAFAKSLLTDYSTLAKILKGVRPVGKNTILRFSSRLGLTPKQVEEFLNHRRGKKAQGKTGQDSVGEDYKQLTLDSFQIISDWYHYAILELMRLDHFKPDKAWISRSLGITLNEVNIAVERLERVGILEVTSDNKWIDHAGGKSTTLGNHFSTGAFRNLQRQVLQKAMVALEEIPMSMRDQTSMTMAIDTRRLPEAKERITKFRREIAKFLSRGESRDEVYNLGISLYPISDSKLKNKKKKEGTKS